MNFLFKDISIFNRKVPLPVLLWFVLAILAAVAEISNVGAIEMAPTTTAIRVERLILITFNLYLSLNPYVFNY